MMKLKTADDLCLHLEDVAVANFLTAEENANLLTDSEASFITNAGIRIGERACIEADITSGKIRANPN